MTNPTQALLLSSALIAVIFLTACNASSRGQEVNDTKLQNVTLASNKEQRDARTESRNVRVVNELEALRDEFDKEYLGNEIRIAELKAKMKPVVTIEKTNDKLKARIETYQQGDVDWDLFKRAFNSDRRSLTKEMNSLSGRTNK
jgi:hypothetical protein